MKNFEVVRESAHFLKSSASAMGFDRLTGFLEELESVADAGQDEARMLVLCTEIQKEFDTLKPRLESAAA